MCWYCYKGAEPFDLGEIGDPIKIWSRGRHERGESTLLFFCRCRGRSGKQEDGCGVSCKSANQRRTAPSCPRCSSTSCAGAGGVVGPKWRNDCRSRAVVRPGIRVGEGGSMRRLRLEVGASVVVYRYVLSLGVQRGYLLRRCELGVVADRCPAHLQHCLKYWYCLIVVTILEINFGVYILSLIHI